MDVRGQRRDGLVKSSRNTWPAPSTNHNLFLREANMSKRWLSLTFVILSFALSVCAQGKIDERGVYNPTDEEIAANKRLNELLRKPTFITLRLVSTPHNFSQQKSLRHSAALYRRRLDFLQAIHKPVSFRKHSHLESSVGVLRISARVIQRWRDLAVQQGSAGEG